MAQPELFPAAFSPRLEVAATRLAKAPVARLIWASPSERPEDANRECGPTVGDVRDFPDDATGIRWTVGVGEAEPEDCREAGAALIRAVDSHFRCLRDAHVITAGVIQLEIPRECSHTQLRHLLWGLLLGGYRYQVTGVDSGAKGRRRAGREELVPVAIRLIVDHEDLVPAAIQLMNQVVSAAAATTLTRDLANTPSNVKDPEWLGSVAELLFSDLPGVEVKVRDESWLDKKAFGGVLAVAGGSSKPPRLIEVRYRPQEHCGKHVLLVGKGITFDTGGLSIKPADGMHLMRTDMAGGAAVLSAIREIASSGVNLCVTALVPSAENHVSGSAYRPGDVVRHHGGKTTEVANTDAEGRLVLADALVYGIERYSPDLVVDVATLTGAMKVALGLRTGAVFANDDALANLILKAGKAVGESWWRMPLLEAHVEAVRGEVADFRQTPPGPQGITAALFLQEFVAGLPWAHLDIAGPARADRDYAEVVAGASGFAARTLVELLTGLSAP